MNVRREVILVRCWSVCVDIHKKIVLSLSLATVTKMFKTNYRLCQSCCSDVSWVCFVYTYILESRWMRMMLVYSMCGTHGSRVHKVEQRVTPRPLIVANSQFVSCMYVQGTQRSFSPQAQRSWVSLAEFLAGCHQTNKEVLLGGFIFHGSFLSCFSQFGRFHMFCLCM